MSNCTNPRRSRSAEIVDDVPQSEKVVVSHDTMVKKIKHDPEKYISATTNCGQEANSIPAGAIFRVANVACISLLRNEMADG